MKSIIEGQYKISIAGKDDWKDFVIPGSAMQAFVESKDIPHPYVGTNEYEVRDFLDNDFVVRGVFAVNKDILSKKNKELILKSVDTVCDVYLNDKLIKHCENAHIKYRIDVSDVIKEANTIEFKFKSATRLINSVKPDKDREITMVNTGTMPNSQYIRKSHSSFGWDWGPHLPDAGIWRDIELTGIETARFRDVYVTQRHEAGRVTLEIASHIEPWAAGETEVTVTVTGPAATTSSFAPKAFVLTLEPVRMPRSQETRWKPPSSSTSKRKERVLPTWNL